MLFVRGGCSNLMLFFVVLVRGRVQTLNEKKSKN